MNLHEAIRTRCSVRRYLPRPVPDEAIRRLLAAAAWAPSAHNRQPWRFVVVRAGAIKTTLAHAMGERLRADRLADGDPVEVVEGDVARSHARITQGPVVIILCLTMDDMDKYPDARRQEAEHTMAVQSAAMAAQNLMLAAHAEGLGACWLCAPLFAPEAVKSVLGLPRDWEPQGLLTVGYPEPGHKTKSRKPLDSLVLWR